MRPTPDIYSTNSDEVENKCIIVSTGGRFHLRPVFRRWYGLSPNAFQMYVGPHFDTDPLFFKLVLILDPSSTSGGRCQRAKFATRGGRCQRAKFASNRPLT